MANEAKMNNYCNCEANCIHKSKRLQKVKTYKDGKMTKTKVQICLNPHRDCTCKWQVSFWKVFNY